MTIDHEEAKARAEWAALPYTEPNKHDGKLLARAYLDLAAQLELCQKVIAWANNSLFGSHSFFLSDCGGPPDEHHLDNQIEVIKKQARDQFVELEAIDAARQKEGA